MQPKWIGKGYDVLRRMTLRGKADSKVLQGTGEPWKQGVKHRLLNYKRSATHSADADRNLAIHKSRSLRQIGSAFLSAGGPNPDIHTKCGLVDTSTSG